MPFAPRETVLCRYRYDPLDRLVDCAPSAEAGIQRFYCKSRLATEIQGAVQRSVFQHDDQLLAQLRRENAKVDTTLLATDQQRSVLNVLDANRLHPLAYTPYGHCPAGNGLLSLLGFNGERPDPVTGHYLLGNGYRGFNPVLMRFNSPDSWSPFGKGGLNAYAYCWGDPTNREDRTGHVPGLRWQWIRQNIKLILGKEPEVSTLRESLNPIPLQKSAPHTAAQQDELMQIIDSQKNIIEQQQKTIESQHQLLANNQQHFQAEVNKLEWRIQELHRDFSTAAWVYHREFPHSPLAINQLDIDYAYGETGLLFRSAVSEQSGQDSPTGRVRK
ncbi:RHS repeat-associated core domain-containing protein [Pseudomonas beijingensis]|jgi:RHS repeat-associated protein|uniref:RHS repeat-associated core domain-containing protein n=1 Tax=Pseudomonas beijingensis TaxID=2954101 RepID=A0ABY9FBN4_9PSED|nr:MULTISPECIES: RHS repeat-associated core domain-containing protein [unclassified Pseudomonas]WLH00803.1 RHS repeat-associated core domain-containing protein [Pseudomonas sp. FP2034]WLI44935.1 RHS repeat-associated core domain-containing protein [Pseudomonas sp. FP830]